jgi:WD40 repeat protein
MEGIMFHSKKTLGIMPLLYILCNFFPFPLSAEERPEIFAQLGHADDITAVAFSPDGKFVLSGDRGGIFKLWDVDTGREVRTFKGHFLVNRIAFSPDGRHAISAAAFDKNLILWDVRAGKEIGKLQGHKDKVVSVSFNKVSSVSFSPDGRYVLEILLFRVGPA